MKPTALIVIHDGYMRRVTGQAFESAGFDVQNADTAPEIYTYTQNTALDVLVLDYSTPGAVDIMKQIRDAINGKLTNIVLMTGDHDIMNSLEGTLADFFLLKPVMVGELNDLAKRLGATTAKTIPYGDKLRAILRERLGQQS
jgi:DNA-binding response OmpR family regulator